MNWKVLVCMLLAAAAIRTFTVVRNPRTMKAAEEQAVILKLKLASGEMGSDEERHRIHDLEDLLQTSIKRSSTGDYDGDEYGKGYCTIYMYGPSADALFRAIGPVLKTYRAQADSFVLKRYGKPGSREDRIPLGVH